MFRLWLRFVCTADGFSAVRVWCIWIIVVQANLPLGFSLIFNPVICKRRVALPHHYRQQRHGDGKNIFVDSSQCSRVYKTGYQLKAGQVKPFVVSLSNHERLNRSPPFGKLRTGFDKLRAKGVSLDRAPP